MLIKLSILSTISTGTRHSIAGAGTGISRVGVGVGNCLTDRILVIVGVCSRVCVGLSLGVCGAVGVGDGGRHVGARGPDVSDVD